MPSRAERKELSRIARRAEDRAAAAGLDDEIAQHRSRKSGAPKPFRLEMRIRPDSGINVHWSGFAGWTKYGGGRYATAARRDVAMKALNRASRLFEYRVPPTD